MNNSPAPKFIYGINPAFEVIRAGKREVTEAILSKSSKKNPRLQKLTEFLKKRSIPFRWEEKGRLIDICKSHDHQGVVLMCSPYKYDRVDTIVENEGRIIMLSNIEDPHNVGAILRSADIFGFHGVMLPSRGTPEIYPSVVKVSTGATEYLRITRCRSANQYMKSVKEAGYTVVALDGKGTSTLEEVAEKSFEKLLLVIGGEDKGVGQFILNEADYVVSIPQSGTINSLNASVAAGVSMHMLRK